MLLCLALAGALAACFKGNARKKPAEESPKQTAQTRETPEEAARYAQIAGKYAEMVRTGSYLLLKADKAFILTETDKLNRKYETRGTYRLDGDKLIFYVEGGGEVKGTLKGKRIEDNQGFIWIKKT